MARNQISKEWRNTLLNKLQDRYGLTLEEATTKTDAWLQWIGDQPRPQTLTAGTVDQHPSSRDQSLVGPAKSRSRTA